MKRYLGVYTTQTRVLKVLALLVESGSVYCVILVIKSFCALPEPKEVPDTLADFGPRIPATKVPAKAPNDTLLRR